MSQSNPNFDFHHSLHRLAYEVPRELAASHSRLTPQFEHLSILYGELASKVTETDILHCLAQKLPNIVPCDRLSYAVPQPKGSRFTVMVFDGKIARPLSFPVVIETSPLKAVVQQQRPIVQLTDAALYADYSHEQWVSCHVPLVIDGELAGVLNVASHHSLSEMRGAQSLICSIGLFLSRTFARIQHQEQAATLLHSQAKQDLPKAGFQQQSAPIVGASSIEILKPFALLFINLDEFRVIPEAQPRPLSSDARLRWGDRLQEHVTESLHSQLRDGDLISRVGSTEFVIALRSDPVANVPQVASRLANLFNQPILLDKQGFHVNCSIGVSFYPEDGKTANELIKKADLAMHEAKIQGPGNVKLYRSEVSDAISRRLQIEKGLTHPNFVDHLNIVYQPQWDCISEQLYGFECLVRWHHPELGSISPTEFIPIAEELGCIPTITHLALTQALKLTRKILDTYDLILRPSVNVSAREFEGMQVLYQMTDQLLHEYQLPGDLLTIELTEGVFLQQSEPIINHMKRFQDRGIRISLDDFGTGFSSLNYLLDLPLNTLKIDRAFVHNIDRDQKRRGVVQAIAAMARSLDMRCIAEGVETDAELECLQEFGCGLIQGYIVSPALSMNSLMDFIEVSQTQSSMNQT